MSRCPGRHKLLELRDGFHRPARPAVTDRWLAAMDLDLLAPMALIQMLLPGLKRGAEQL